MQSNLRVGSVQYGDRTFTLTTTYNAPVLKGDHVNLKWGVYRSGRNHGHSVGFVNDPKLGATYDSVKP